MKQSEFDWKNGKVVQWAIDDLDTSRPETSQLEMLQEDMVQVKFGASVVVDLGWYPALKREGWFVLVVVKSTNKNNSIPDWENPILKLQFKNIQTLVQKMDQAIKVAHLTSIESS